MWVIQFTNFLNIYNPALWFVDSLVFFPCKSDVLWFVDSVVFFPCKSYVLWFVDSLVFFPCKSDMLLQFWFRCIISNVIVIKMFTFLCFRYRQVWVWLQVWLSVNKLQSTTHLRKGHWVLVSVVNMLWGDTHLERKDALPVNCVKLSVPHRWEGFKEQMLTCIILKLCIHWHVSFWSCLTN